jgi:leucyl aminopeptidase (aminopeptidase T)
MGVKPRESVLVVATPPKMRIAEALIEASGEVGAQATLILMQTHSRHGEEPPEPVANVMRAADVVFAPTTYSLTHTQARLQACRAGARVATMPMITEKMMCRGAMLADYKQVSKLTIKVAKLLDKASEVEVRTGAGTFLTFSIEGRGAHPDTGIFHRPGDFGNLPAGEAFIAPVEGTAEGRVIVDGSMVDRLRGQIEIIVMRGRATKLSGKPAGRLIKMLDETGSKAYNLAEFGIGTNPKARLIGNVLEDEKVLGTCHIALGDNSTFGGRVRAGIHVDGIFLKPTVKLDGKTIMERGKFKV